MFFSSFFCCRSNERNHSQTFRRMLMYEHFALFTDPATTDDSFAEQLADVIGEELDRVALQKSCLRRQSKPTTKWFSEEAADAKRGRRLKGVWKRHGLESGYVAYRRSCCLTKKLDESRRLNHQIRLAECPNSGKM